MKIIAAALLALCATALKIKEEVKEEVKTEGGSGGGADLPFPDPECPPKPDTEGVDDAGIFAMIDADGNGEVSAQEGYNAVFCAVKWGEMEEDDAMWMYDYMTSHAGVNPDGNPDALDIGEAGVALDRLKKWKETNKKRKENGKRPFPSPVPDCPPMPNAEIKPEEAWKMVDQNKNGKIDTRESFEALYCLVEWEVLGEDAAFAVFDFIGEHAGDDGELDKTELDTAIEAAKAMSEEELAARVEGASLEKTAA